MQGPDLKNPVEPGAPSQRRASFFGRLAWLIGGCLWVYWIFKDHGWHSGADLGAMWKQFETLTRAEVVAGVIAIGWGLGGIIDELVRQAHER